MSFFSKIEEKLKNIFLECGYEVERVNFVTSSHVVVSKFYHIETSIIYHIFLLYNIPFISFFLHFS